MDKELYLVGIDSGNGTSIKPSVCLFKIGDNGILQCLDIYNLKENLSEQELQKEIDKISGIYENLYADELSNLNSDSSKWYSKFESGKLKVNSTLLEQLKQFQFH